jgi:hypothetical protein
MDDRSRENARPRLVKEDLPGPFYPGEEEKRKASRGERSVEKPSVEAPGFSRTPGGADDVLLDVKRLKKSP